MPFYATVHGVCLLLWTFPCSPALLRRADYRKRARRSRGQRHAAILLLRLPLTRRTSTHKRSMLWVEGRSEAEIRRRRPAARNWAARCRPVDDFQPRALNMHDDVPPVAREFTQWMILAGTLLVAVLLGVPLCAQRGPNCARAAYHRSTLLAHDGRGACGVAASPSHRTREDLLRSRVGVAGRLHARQTDRRAEPRRGACPLHARVGR